MERTITFILTNVNDKKVINSNATTLGELKSEMTANGIDYKDMDFIEGLSHTIMMDDDAILPTNVTHKGKTTNNLVFMLSTTNKKIKSGVYTRQECYKIIKEKNLQDKIKSATGDNYTRITTDMLNTIISKEETKSKSAEKTIPATDRKALYETVKRDNLAESIKEKTGKNYTNLSTLQLAEIVNDLLKPVKSAKKETVKKSEKKVVESPYSDTELDNIVKKLRK